MTDQRHGPDVLPGGETLPGGPLAVPDPVRARRRQQMFMAIGGAVLFAVVMGGMWLAGAGPAGTGDDPGIASTRFHVPGQSLNEREAWMAEGEAELKDHEKQLKELQRWKEQQEQRQKEVEQTGQAQGSVAPPAGTMPPPPPLLSAFTPPPVIPAAAAGNGAVRPLPPGAPPLRTDPGAASDGRPLSGAAGILHVSLGQPKAASEPRSEGDRDSDRKIAKEVGTYLPAGSIARAVLLGGLDAPTGGQAQTNPHPVVLQIIDHSILPNRFRARTKECHVIGAGYGDISSERAYIRTETLSCVLRNGQVLEIPLKGYVAGEDGKTGLRGQVVEKGGQLLAKALIAGLGSGFGQALAQTATTVSVSPLGATQTVDPSRVFERGAYTGVGRALDRLAQYYISLAEKTFPIVEVAAGRTVEIVMTGGVLLDADINKLAASGAPDETDEEDIP